MIVTQCTLEWFVSRHWRALSEDAALFSISSNLQAVRNWMSHNCPGKNKHKSPQMAQVLPKNLGKGGRWGCCNGNNHESKEQDDPESAGLTMYGRWWQAGVFHGVWQDHNPLRSSPSINKSSNILHISVLSTKYQLHLNHNKHIVNVFSSNWDIHGRKGVDTISFSYLHLIYKQ